MRVKRKGGSIIEVVISQSYTVNMRARCCQFGDSKLSNKQSTHPVLEYIQPIEDEEEEVAINSLPPSDTNREEV
jgi:hypothetical protein